MIQWWSSKQSNEQFSLHITDKGDKKKTVKAQGPNMNCFPNLKPLRITNIAKYITLDYKYIANSLT